MKLNIIEPIGLCPSAKRILDEVDNNLNKYDTIYVLGEILHNEFVINDLSKKGIKFVKDIKNITNKYSLVLLPSHGTSPIIVDKLKKYKLLDLTCPKIKKMHEYVIENINRDVIFLGKKGHTETLSFKDYKNVTIINDVNDINNLDNLKDPIIMCQTTMNKDIFINASEKLKEKYPNLVINNTLCNIPLDRIIHIKNTPCDLLIVVGSKSSSNANEIKNSKENSMIVNTIKDINIDELKQYNVISIASASSTPIEQVNKIVDYLKKNLTID